MKYAVVTFGCRVNQADSLGFEEQLLASGAIAAAPQDADLVVVNSCSVTATADQGTRQTIRRIARDNPRARIVVTGCYATRRPDEVAALPNVERVVSNDDKPRLIQLLRNQEGTGENGNIAEKMFFFANSAISPVPSSGDRPCGATIEPGVAGRTAFTLRVQTGCAEPCSYCIIPSTRGAPRSVPVEEILREVARVIAAGFKEIALTGVHLGSYGRDLEPRASLTDLLRALDAAAEAREAAHGSQQSRGEDGSAAVRFRISSLEPMDCSREVIDLVVASDRFAPHFHLPLQHASNRVLAAMRRPYTIQYYAALVDDIRARVANASIGSDIIVGFPGETDDDFEELAAYLERSPLTHIHVFPYSDRPGTAASTMAGKVGGAIVRERGRRIREIGRVLTERFRRSQIGTVQRALTLDDGTMAVTGNYVKVRIPAGQARNEWIRVRMTSENDGELLRGCLLRPFHDQLAAGGADVAAAALANRHADPVIGDDLREPIDHLIGRPLERNPRRGVERDDVHLRLQRRHQSGQLARILRRVVDAGEQHILEGDAAAAAEREAAAGIDDLGDAVLAVERHELAALAIGRRVQRDRQVRHHRLVRQLLERRQQSDRRQRHAPR